MKKQQKCACFAVCALALFLCACSSAGPLAVTVPTALGVEAFAQVTETPLPTVTPTPEITLQPTPGAKEKATAKPTVTAKPTATPKEDGIVSMASTAYGYADMQADITALLKAYPQLLTKTSAGTSEFGRDLTVLVLGNPDNPNRILIQGTIHAREYATTQIIMKSVEAYCQGFQTGTYAGTSYQELTQNCAIWFLPMLNPDGVEICLHGLSSVPASYQALVSSIYQKSLQAGLLQTKTGYTKWKANGLGVDLNQNFGTGNREKAVAYTYPMSEGYNGGAPFSTAETRAIRDFCVKWQFQSLTSYHACGNIIYWAFGQTDALLSETTAMAERLKSITGYELVQPDMTPDDASDWGLKDWFLTVYRKPGFTIEIGAQTLGTPVPLTEVNTAYTKNKNVALYLCWHVGNRSVEPTNTTVPDKTKEPTVTSSTQEPTAVPAENGED